MKKYKDDIQESDTLREWLKNSEDVSAPEGFTHNVMTRINLESLSARGLSASFPGVRFRITSMIVFIVLILSALFIPSIDHDSLPSFLLWSPDFSRISLDLKFPDFQTLHADLTLMYISLGIFLLILLNIIIEKFNWSGKR